MAHRGTLWHSHGTPAATRSGTLWHSVHPVARPWYDRANTWEEDHHRVAMQWQSEARPRTHLEEGEELMRVVEHRVRVKGGAGPVRQLVCVEDLGDWGWGRSSVCECVCVLDPRLGG